MTLLRWIKLIVMIGVPVLGALYVYQFRGQAREVVRPFEPMRIPSNKVYLPGKKDAATEFSYDAKVTVINFWATWCPPCVEEFPSMLELQRVMAKDGLKLIFVSVDENWADVDAFMKKYNITVPEGQLFWDPEKKAAAEWGSVKFPETYVLRADGWVVEKIIGLQNWTRPAVLEYFRNLTRKFEGLTPSPKIN